MTQVTAGTSCPSSFHRTSGRRPRVASAPSDATTTTTTVKSKTVADAKAKFAASVSRGISVLMEECGYSRERAQTALLQEMSRGDASPPDDQEIFQAMSTLGLGIEGAARALTVSKALQRETAQRNVSMLDAIDDLTSKLSVANLIRVDRGARSVVVGTSPMPPRIQPVAPVAIPRQTTATSVCSSNFNTTTTTHSSTSGRKGQVAGKTAKQRHGNSNNNRKRPAQDIRTTNHPGHSSSSSSSMKAEEANECFPTRARSDSLSEVVIAKFGDGKVPAEDTSSTVRPGALPPPAVVRAKRGRVDEGEPPHGALKRSRGTTDL